MREFQPIGFFDSGSGGISVLAAFRHVLPQENYLYFGDHAHLPYGEKTPGEIRALTLSACDYLDQQGIKALVVACNTASTAALDLIQARYSFPVMGIEPPLEAAAKLPGAGKILVMGTPATMASDRYNILSAPYGKRFLSLPCPGLAALVESEDRVAQAACLDRLFHPIRRENISGIALGCTHYPLIRGLIAQVFDRPVPILDGYMQAASRTRDQMQKSGLLNQQRKAGKVTLISSLGAETEKRLKRFMAQQSAAIEANNQDAP